MNEIIKAITMRRSIRKFKPEMPPRADIEQIIEAGLYAPSGMGKQSAITIAVTSPEIRERLRADNCRIGGWDEGFDPFYGAPVILVVLADRNWANRVYDGSLMMGNMLLAAHALGLGSIWIHRARQEFEMPSYQQLLQDLGVPGEWEGIGHCAVGYIDGEIPAPAKRREGRVFWAE
ncbi:MAG: nitroreductase [Succinivibrionaceae bacterium]|nr:nitroreductase [Succinivibrionaceae bacterium]